LLFRGGDGPFKEREVKERGRRGGLKKGKGELGRGVVSDITRILQYKRIIFLENQTFLPYGTVLASWF